MATGLTLEQLKSKSKTRSPLPGVTMITSKDPREELMSYQQKTKSQPVIGGFLTKPAPNLPGLTSITGGQEDNRGMVQQIAQGVAQPALSVIEGVKDLYGGAYDIGRYGYGKLTGNEEMQKDALADTRERAFDTERDYGYLGKVTPFGRKMYDPVTEKVDYGAGTKEVVGTAADFASYASGGKALQTVGRGFTKGVLLPTVKASAIESGAGGFLSGAGQSLRAGDSVGQSLEEGLIGGVVGAGAGSLLGGISAGIGKGASYIAGRSNPVVQRQKIIDILAKDVEPSIRPTMRKKQGELWDWKEAIADDIDVLKGIKIDGIKFDTSLAKEVVENRKNQIGSLISDNVKNVKGQANFETIRERAIQNLNGTDLTEAQKKNAINTINNEVNALIESSNTGFVGWDVIQDNIPKFSRNINWKTPNPDRINNNVYKVLRDTVSDYLFENAPTKTLKNLKSEYGQLSNLYDVLDDIDTKPAKGGRLGKYVASIAGAVAGSPGGGFGSIVGGVAADKFYGIMRDANIPYTSKVKLYEKVLGSINPQDVKLRQFVEDTFREVAEGSNQKMLSPAPAMGTDKNPFIMGGKPSMQPDNPIKVSPADYTEYTDPKTGESYFIFKSNPRTQEFIKNNVADPNSVSWKDVKDREKMLRNEDLDQLKGAQLEQRGAIEMQISALEDALTDARRGDEIESAYQKWKSYQGSKKYELEDIQSLRTSAQKNIKRTFDDASNQANERFKGDSYQNMSSDDIFEYIKERASKEDLIKSQLKDLKQKLRDSTRMGGKTQVDVVPKTANMSTNMMAMSTSVIPEDQANEFKDKYGFDPRLVAGIGAVKAISKKGLVDDVLTKMRKTLDTETVKELDNLVDYIRSGKHDPKLEKYIDYTTEKFGIFGDTRKEIATNIQKFLNSVKEVKLSSVKPNKSSNK